MVTISINHALSKFQANAKLSLDHFFHIINLDVQNSDLLQHLIDYQKTATPEDKEKINSALAATFTNIELTEFEENFKCTAKLLKWYQDRFNYYPRTAQYIV